MTKPKNDKSIKCRYSPFRHNDHGGFPHPQVRRSSRAPIEPVRRGQNLASSGSTPALTTRPDLRTARHFVRDPPMPPPYMGSPGEPLPDVSDVRWHVQQASRFRRDTRQGRARRRTRCRACCARATQARSTVCCRRPMPSSGAGGALIIQQMLSVARGLGRWTTSCCHSRVDIAAEELRDQFGIHRRSGPRPSETEAKGKRHKRVAASPSWSRHLPSSASGCSPVTVFNQDGLQQTAHSSTDPLRPNKFSQWKTCRDRPGEEESTSMQESRAGVCRPHLVY